MSLSDTSVQRYLKALPMLLISQRNYMKIVFHGGLNQEARRGFQVDISFENLNCGGILTEVSNETTVDKIVDPPEKCEWILEGKQYRLNLFYVPKSAEKDKSLPSLLIYGSTSIDDPNRLLLYK